MPSPSTLLFKQSPKASGQRLVIGKSEHVIDSLSRRSRFSDLDHPESWNYLGQLNSRVIPVVRLFETGSGRKIVVRTSPLQDAERIHFDAPNSMARIIGSKIRFEQPLGYFTSSESGATGSQYSFSYVSEFIEGDTLASLSKNGWAGVNKRELVADSLVLLAKLHSSGMVHGHPHFDNLVRDRRTGNVHLIDPTLIRSLADISLQANLGVEPSGYRVGSVKNDLHRFLADAKNRKAVTDLDEMAELVGKHYRPKGAAALSKEDVAEVISRVFSD